LAPESIVDLFGLRLDGPTSAGALEGLFNAQFDVLLYDLTNTYVEGEAELNPKAKHGYSRDGRPDCKQVVVGLIITPDGFPLAYEVMDGNRG
jgi:transposase